MDLYPILKHLKWRNNCLGDVQVRQGDISYKFASLFINIERFTNDTCNMIYLTSSIK